jgi:hypothetical protein
VCPSRDNVAWPLTTVHWRRKTTTTPWDDQHFNHPSAAVRGDCPRKIVDRRIMSSTPTPAAIPAHGRSTARPWPGNGGEIAPPITPLRQTSRNPLRRRTASTDCHGEHFVVAVASQAAPIGVPFTCDPPSVPKMNRRSLGILAPAASL